MATATRMRQSNDLSEVLNSSVRARSSARSKTESAAQFANIESNPVFQIAFNPDASPAEKKELLAKFRTFTEDKETERLKQKQYDEFKEYLQENRALMAKEIIALTDTETFAELQATYRDINNDFIQFEDDMKPLTDLIDAVYILRTSGKTMEAFKEIKLDQTRSIELEARRQEAKNNLELAKSKVDKISKEIAQLGTEKSFFGFGGVKPAAQAKIAALQVDLDNAIAEVSEAEKVLEAAMAETVSTNSILQTDNPEDTAKLLAAKEKLSELLNLSSEEHTERQKALVQSALNFIETSKERIGAIRSHLSGMETQIDNLSDTNTRMTEIYAIMTEAEKEAAKANQKIREELAKAPEDEDLIAKMTRETKQRDVDEHIKAVAQSTVDTQATYADLASGAIRILTMKDATKNQQVKAYEMQSRGVAGIADRLSTVLQAVSGAAISEAQSMATNTLQMMSDSTNKIAQKESIRVAMNIQETNDDLMRIAADLESYGEVSRSATDIIRTGLMEMEQNLEEIARIRDDVQRGYKEAIGINAEVQSGSTGSSGATGTLKKGGAGAPFPLGKAV